MKKYIADYWLRMGDEKDCFQEEVFAKSKKEARALISHKRGVIQRTIEITKVKPTTKFIAVYLLYNGERVIKEINTYEEILSIQYELKAKKFSVYIRKFKQ